VRGRGKGKEEKGNGGEGKERGGKGEDPQGLVDTPHIPYPEKYPEPISLEFGVTSTLG